MTSNGGVDPEIKSRWAQIGATPDAMRDPCASDVNGFRVKTSEIRPQFVPPCLNKLPVSCSDCHNKVNHRLESTVETLGLDIVFCRLKYLENKKLNMN